MKATHGTRKNKKNKLHISKEITGKKINPLSTVRELHGLFILNSHGWVDKIMG